MSRRLISTDSPFERVAGYSRAVVSGDWCFVAGTTGYDYAAMRLPDEAGEQARAALATVAACLDEAGFAMADVVRARYVVSDRDHVDAVFAALGEAFGDIRPAATMTVSSLIEPAMKVEIDVTAHRPTG